MDLARFTEALVSYAEQKDSVAALTTWRDSLFNLITAGQGKTLVNSSPGGKSFTFQVTMTNEDAFACVVNAIRQYNETAGDGPITFIDFSGIAPQSAEWPY